MANRRRFGASYFFGSLLLLLGLWVCSLGILDEIEEIKSAKWPTAQGRSTWIENKYLLFDYQVSGNKYRSGTFSFVDSGDLAAFRLRHPEGSAATVRYDPRDPAHCLVEIPAPANHVGFLWPGSVIVICGVVFLVAYWREDEPTPVEDNVKTGFETKKDPLEMATLWTCGALVVSLGLLAIVSGVTSSWKTVRAGLWPTTTAEIVHMQVDTTVTDSSKPDEVSSRPAVAYRYNVNGKTYFSGQRRFGATGTRIEHMVSTYPVGKRVTAHYSPDNPQIAVLEAGFDTEHLILPAFGMIPILFVIVFVWVGRFVTGQNNPFR